MFLGLRLSSGRQERRGCGWESHQANLAGASYDHHTDYCPIIAFRDRSASRTHLQIGSFANPKIAIGYKEASARGWWNASHVWNPGGRI